MTKDQIKVGSVYLTNHTSGKINARVLRETTHQHYGGRGTTNPRRTWWVCFNLKTKHEITIKSAQKFLREVPDPDKPADTPAPVAREKYAEHATDDHS